MMRSNDNSSVEKGRKSVGGSVQIVVGEEAKTERSRIQVLVGRPAGIQFTDRKKYRQENASNLPPSCATSHSALDSSPNHASWLPKSLKHLLPLPITQSPPPISIKRQSTSHLLPNGGMNPSDPSRLSSWCTCICHKGVINRVQIGRRMDRDSRRSI